MPSHARFRIGQLVRVAVALATLAGPGLSACGGDTTVEDDDGNGTAADPAGLYVSTCDEAATMEFVGGGVANVNRNQCEGYAAETWDYAVDGTTLTMAPQGKLGDPDIVQETFEVADPDTLVLTRETSFLACGNCVAGDTWVRQR